MKAYTHVLFLTTLTLGLYPTLLRRLRRFGMHSLKPFVLVCRIALVYETLNIPGPSGQELFIVVELHLHQCSTMLLYTRQYM
jgi:hypothetical protein